MQVLLVDDDRASQRLLERQLERWGYQVTKAPDGQVALDILEADPEISLMITDWMMPRMNGIELCRRARALKRTTYLHILMLTMREEKSDLLESFEAGVDAFLSKPCDPSELRAHLKVAERVQRLENNLAGKVEELAKAHQTLRSELEAAGRIQRSLLPSVAPKIDYIETGWSFQSCNVTAGDMLNVVRLDEHHLGLYVLDVSGHGCQAALLSVSLSRVLNPYPQQGGILKQFAEGRSYRIPSPAEVALELNRRFPVMRQSGQFFTFLYGVLDIRSLKLCYTRAGHSEPIHYSHGTCLRHEDQPSVPVGIVEAPDYTDYTMQLDRGDLLLFVTDGFEEAKNAEGREFGRESLEATLRVRPLWTIDAAIAAVQADLQAFTQEAAQMDDMTIVGLSIHPDFPLRSPASA